MFICRFYSPALMKPEARDTFYTWYNEHKDDHFDFQKELEFYCRLDVEILMKGCLIFRETMLKVCCSSVLF